MGMEQAKQAMRERSADRHRRQRKKQDKFRGIKLSSGKAIPYGITYNCGKWEVRFKNQYLGRYIDINDAVTTRLAMEEHFKSAHMSEVLDGFKALLNIGLIPNNGRIQ